MGLRYHDVVRARLRQPCRHMASDGGAGPLQDTRLRRAQQRSSTCRLPRRRIGETREGRSAGAPAEIPHPTLPRLRGRVGWGRWDTRSPNAIAFAIATLLLFAPP